MPYKLTDSHSSADIGLVATGRDLEEMLADAALGMTSIMVDLDGVREERELEIEIRGDNPETLFLHWLSEIIYIKDVEQFLLKRCKIHVSEENGLILRGRLCGDRIDSQRQVLKIDVKAVTYYKLRVEKIDNQWQGEAVFDL